MKSNRRIGSCKQADQYNAFKTLKDVQEDQYSPTKTSKDVKQSATFCTVKYTVEPTDNMNNMQKV